MTQFLFVIDIPAPGISSEDPSAASRWFAFEKKASAIALPKGSPKKSARNVWILKPEGADTILAELISAAKECQFSFSTFLLSGEVTPLTK